MLLKADVIFDAGVQSIMAEYSIPLWEQFDLLYVDSSYGTESADYELVKSHLAGYIGKNLEFGNRGWLGLDYAGAKITDILLATDFNGLDFYLQAVDVVKASVGVPYIEQMLTWFDRIDSTQNMGDFLESEAADIDKIIEDTNGTQVEVKEAVYEEVDIENPLDKILSGNILLRQVIDDYSFVSSENVEAHELASHRPLAMGTIQEMREEGSFLDKAFFCKYVTDHFACYRELRQNESEALQCELEYLIGGKSCDAQNLEIVTAKLLLIRQIDNYLLLLQDGAKKVEAHEIATAVTAALVPWMEPVIYQALLIYWAYEESVQDLQALFKGESVPLAKSLPLNASDNVSLSYEEYLFLLLLMQDREHLVMRSIDIIEFSLRKEDTGFRMDACIGQAHFIGEFYDRYDKRYTISGKIQYG